MFNEVNDQEVALRYNSTKYVPLIDLNHFHDSALCLDSWYDLHILNAYYLLLASNIEDALEYKRAIAIGINLNLIWGAVTDWASVASIIEYVI